MTHHQTLCNTSLISMVNFSKQTGTTRRSRNAQDMRILSVHTSTTSSRLVLSKTTSIIWASWWVAMAVEKSFRNKPGDSATPRSRSISDLRRIDMMWRRVQKIGWWLDIFDHLASHFSVSKVCIYFLASRMPWLILPWAAVVALYYAARYLPSRWVCASFIVGSRLTINCYCCSLQGCLVVCNF